VRLVLNVGMHAWLVPRQWVILATMKPTAAKVDAIGDHMRDVDRTLLRENLKLTFEQRAEKHLRALQMVEELGALAKS
jgi:hypothetical protein